MHIACPANAPRRMRRGTLMLGLLVTIAILALLAARVVPDYSTEVQRRNEQHLKQELATYRFSFDLERMSGTFSPASASFASLTADPTNRAYLEAYLGDLERGRLLRRPSLDDQLVSRTSWGTASGRLYWQATPNLLQPLRTGSGALASNGISSFEAGSAYDANIGTITPIGWKNVLDPNLAVATLSPDTPSNNSNGIDDYNGQNKSGNLLGIGGNSLVIEHK